MHILSILKKVNFTAQKIKFCIKDFFSKCDQISSFLKKSLKESFIFCAVFTQQILKLRLDFLFNDLNSFSFNTVINY